MTEFLTVYKPEILNVLSFIYLPFLVFLVSLGNVYIFGRMLGLLKKPHPKNLLAIITMVSCYFFYFWIYKPEYSINERIWLSIIYIAITSIFYTIIGFKFHERADAWLDRKIASDKKVTK